MDHNPTIGPGSSPATAPDEVPTECQNCAIPDDDLVAVRRVYLIPETWDQPASETIVDETEFWCVSCCTQYPNLLVDSIP